MPYGTCHYDTRAALAYLGEGVIIEDPEFPESETADVSVVIEGALDEEFAVVSFLAREVARTLFVYLTQKYRSLSVEIFVNVGPEDDRTEIVRYSTIEATERLRASGMLDS